MRENEGCPPLGNVERKKKTQVILACPDPKNAQLSLWKMIRLHACYAHVSQQTESKRKVEKYNS